MLASEEHPMKVHTNQWLLTIEMWARKRLRIKRFHGISSGNPHAYSLQSRYGKVSILTTPISLLPIGFSVLPLSLERRRDTPLKISVFSWVVVSAKLMGDSAENSPAIFMRGGEPDSWVTVGQPPSTEIGVLNMSSWKAKKLRKLSQEKYS
jgi:hypothetical protein